MVQRGGAMSLREFVHSRSKTQIGGLLCIVSILAYCSVSGTWQADDVIAGFRLVGILWFPPAFLIYRWIRFTCVDSTEAWTLAAASSFTAMPAVNCFFSTIAVWWPSAELLWPATIAGCALTAGAIAVRSAWKVWRNFGTSSCRRQLPWLLIFLIIGSLVVTARYERAWSTEAHGKSLRFVLNGDQTYFTAVAYELQRSNPPAQHPTRAGVPERAYHHFPHLTLAIAGAVSGQSDLLRLSLVVIYPMLVAVHVLLAYCIARILGGANAGAFAGCLIFIAAVPLEPRISTQQFFYFSIFPHATSTIEPTLLTSPQAFYGLVPGMAAILGLLVSLRKTTNMAYSMRISALTIIFTALTIKFRVHCFLVLGPTVFGFLALNAWWRRHWLLLAPLGLGMMIIGLQLVEMRLPSYLSQSQSVSLGLNHVLETSSFYSEWPGSLIFKDIVLNVFGPSLSGEIVWSFGCLCCFCILNMIGIPMVLAAAATIRTCFMTPDMKHCGFIPLVIFCGTVSSSLLVRSGYDSYSVGGQIPFHLGWYLLPWSAAGLSMALSWVSNQLKINPRWQLSLGIVIACSFVAWQVFRGLGPIERKNFSESLVLSPDDNAALTFVRTMTPKDAVILTALLQPNYALWSGLGGRRTYLDYIPAGKALDPALPPDGQVDFRVRVIQRLQATTSEDELAAILRETHATHIIEMAAQPLQIHPSAMLKPSWDSPRGSIRIWEVR
ncbi:MAG: hypothetical protein NTX48_20155 [Planctomycetales bacterium]|nr:hypothetical protein [Planctomycetales bacterium]